MDSSRSATDPYKSTVLSNQLAKLVKLSRRRRAGPLTDPIYDFGLYTSREYKRALAAAAEMPKRRVLVAAVDVPARREGLEYVIRELSKTRHGVTFVRAPLGDAGKFDNVAVGIEGVDVSQFDWFIVFDDDIILPDHFLDLFLYISEKASLAVSQPAHRIYSYQSFDLTKRTWRSLARTTRFVECGPLTAFHKSVFADILPFPPSRYGWGLDLLWAEAASRRNLKVGVVDATPIKHTRPVAGSYKNHDAAVEMKTLLQSRGVPPDWQPYLVVTQTHRHL